MSEFTSICLHWKAVASFLMLPVLAVLGVSLAGTVGIIGGVAIGGGLIGYVLSDLEKKNNGESVSEHSVDG